MTDTPRGADDGAAPTILVTGGAGFFGDLFKRHMLELGYICVSIDMKPDPYSHPRLRSIQGDIRDADLLTQLGQRYDFLVIYHFAAMLAHAIKDKKVLWASNVDGTRNIARMAAQFRIPKVIFTSSNCLWAENHDRPVTEMDAPRPVEIYGRSKLAAERILLSRDDFVTVVLRCPTIIDSGRLGLLAILFEFIDAGKRVWIVGAGDNRLQFIYAQDLIDACVRAADHGESAVFNVGSDDVKTLRSVYAHVIERAQTGARLASLPRRTTLLALKLAYWLKLSPLGPYQYRMIAGNFIFDTTKIRDTLGWKPTLTDEEMLYRGYRFFHDHRGEIVADSNDLSPHKQSAKMGVIRVLKWIS